MYFLLKNYKNLDEHRLKGYVRELERLEKRYFVIQFYPLSRIEKENFCSIFQQRFEIKYFFFEEIFLEKKYFKNKKKTLF